MSTAALITLFHPIPSPPCQSHSLSHLKLLMLLLLLLINCRASCSAVSLCSHHPSVCPADTGVSQQVRGNLARFAHFLRPESPDPFNITEPQSSVASVTEDSWISAAVTSAVHPRIVQNSNVSTLNRSSSLQGRLKVTRSYFDKSRRTAQNDPTKSWTASLWSPYVIGQTIIFSSCFFLLLSSSFFHRLISPVGDWMSAILPHMVWP